MTLLINILTWISVFTVGLEKYPIPDKNENHLFYIQRTVNTNTVIYEANFDENGFLNPQKPINVYWIDYEKGGKISRLNLLEKRFAYGVRHWEKKACQNEFIIKLAAYEKLPMTLKLSAPFKADLWVENMGKNLKLDHVFISANNKGLLTKVESIKLYLQDTDSNSLIEKEVYEK